MPAMGTSTFLEQAMPPYFSWLQSKCMGVCGQHLALHKACGPSLRDGVQHAINSFVCSNHGTYL